MPRFAVYLLVPLCYFAGAKLGVLTAVMPEGIAVLWPPNAVLLAAMLLTGPRGIPLVAALGIASEVVADLPTFTVPEAVIFGAANAIEATLACLLLRAWGFDPRLGTLADLRKFLLAGPLVAAPAAALLGAAAYTLYRSGGTPYLEYARVWWLGDAIGLLIFAPLLLSVTAGGIGGSRRVGPRRLWMADVFVGLATLVLTATQALSVQGSLLGMELAPVLLIPCVMYFAARFDVRVVSGVVAVVGVTVAYATAHGRHPFGVLPPHTATMRTQEFILTMSLLALGLTALLAQLRAKRHELAEANERLDQLNRSLEARVAERTAQLAESNRELQRLAMTDSLTGLLNRRAFYEIAQRAVDNALRHHRPLAAVMIDLDHFKAVNDTHGHAAGDAVLRHVASVLGAMVREGDCLARYGGEEFVLLAPETTLDSAVALAERMAQALRNTPAPAGALRIPLTATFGVTALGAAGDGIELLIRRADAALYEGKDAGRDRVVAARPPARPGLPAAPGQTSFPL